MDVCQSNGNLVAIANGHHNIKIFDQRESAIVKVFEQPLLSSRSFYFYVNINLCFCLFVVSSSFKQYQLRSLESKRKYPCIR